MELEYSVQAHGGTSTEPEVRWWYSCRGEEVERMGSTAVWYLMQQMISRLYTLEYTQEVPVSFVESAIFKNQAIPICMEYSTPWSTHHYSRSRTKTGQHCHAYTLAATCYFWNTKNRKWLGVMSQQFNWAHVFCKGCSFGSVSLYTEKLTVATVCID